MMKRLAMTAALTTLVVVGACNEDEEMTNPNPDMGFVSVNTETTGNVALDTDGYQLVLQSAGDVVDQAAIDANGTASFDAQAAGTYDVQLTGVEVGCTVQSANPQEISVTEGETVKVTFQVDCQEV